MSLETMPFFVLLNQANESLNKIDRYICGMTEKKMGC